MIESSIARHPEANAISQYDGEPITYRELGRKMKEISATLKLNGIKKGDRVAILGENSTAWALSYLAVVTMGAIAVPILPDFPAEDVENILNHSESKILFSTRKLMESVNFENCPKIREVILLDDFSVEDLNVNASRFEEFVITAMDKIGDLIHDLETRVGLVSEEVEEDDLAVIIYTSGTTGLSKGVMLTHKNLISNVLATNDFVVFTKEDRFLSLLPMSHAIESTIGFLLALTNNACVYFVGKTPSPTIIKEAADIVKPSCMVWVPLLMEKIYKKRVLTKLEGSALMKKISSNPAVRKAIYKKAVKKILTFLGGNIKVIAMGGAPLSREVNEFLEEGGFPYVLGYGLTETAPLVTGERIGETRVGSAGYPIPHVQVKIEDPDSETGVGEVYVKGPNVMKGYYKNPELTKEVLSDDGWFKTGDKACVDEDGFVYIKGRSKNMFLGANGENIYPEVIEEKLGSILTVKESLVIDNKGDIEALIHLDVEHLEPKLKGKSDEERNMTISEILEEIRHEVNKRLPDFSRIKRCFFHSEPFMKTATQKIKRYLYYRDAGQKTG